MKIKLFQVDAFADKLFSGNPAAVCPLPHWLDDAHLQSIAEENNLSETAFFVEDDHQLHLRWFTPTTEVELCGHATLATAHVLATELGYTGKRIEFDSQSGKLGVIVDGTGKYTLDFPADELRPLQDQRWHEHFKCPIKDGRRGLTDYIFRLESEEAVIKESPNFSALKDADGRGFIVTAPGESCDYVARCFYPQAGINEDPATGSSQTTLAVYWHSELGKTDFEARQLSKRGAKFITRVDGDRVLITGKAVTYLRGEIDV